MLTLAASHVALDHVNDRNEGCHCHPIEDNEHLQRVKNLTDNTAIKMFKISQRG